MKRESQKLASQLLNQLHAVLCRAALTGLVAVLVGQSTARGATVVGTIDGGGGRSASAAYSNLGSVGGIIGTSSATTPPVTVFAGYIGQVSGEQNGPAAPLASFYASATLGGAPLPVTFTDTSSGSITNRHWTFGDNSTTNTTLASLVHTYRRPGTNTVTLIVSGLAGLSTNSLPNYIVATAVDTIGDSLPNWWRAWYFGGTGATTNGQTCAICDADLDGFSNQQEYLAGTDPTNAASPPVRDFVAAAKLQYYDQPGSGSPTPAVPGYGFYAAVDPAVSNTLGGVTNRVPGGALKALLPDAGTNDYSFSQSFATQPALDAAYSNGVYTLAIATRPGGSFNPALNLPAAAYPNVPQILDYSAAQDINAAADFVVSWTNFVGGSVQDFISLEIDDAQQKLVFQTPAFAVAGHLAGPATSVVIPAGKLDASGSYTGRLMFVKVAVLDSNSIPGAVGITGYGVQTVFELNTAGGGLWAGATDLGGDWKWLDWFGYFNTNAEPWINHQQHGWLNAVGTDPSSIWFWDLGMNAWWWTSDTEYPYVYRSSDAVWLYYQVGSSNPRWFYNLKTSIWEIW